MPDPDPMAIRHTENLNSYIAKKDLIFPHDVQEQGKMISFSFWQYSKNMDYEFEKNTSLGSITLPLPPQLHQEDALNYSDLDGGLLARALKAGIPSLDELGSLVGSLGSIDMDTIRNGPSTNLIGLPLDILYQGLSVSPEARGIVESQFGLSMNPRKMSVFKDVGLRTYQFQYNMIARTEEDSDVVRDIVRKLKFHSHPNSPESIYSGNLFYHPDLVDFKFIPDELNEYMFTPNMCAITSVAVSYNGQSTPVFFKRTGAPVEVQLTFQLKEMTVDTKQTLMKKWGEDVPEEAAGEE